MNRKERACMEGSQRDPIQAELGGDGVVKQQDSNRNIECVRRKSTHEFRDGVADKQWVQTFRYIWTYHSTRPARNQRMASRSRRTSVKFASAHGSDSSTARCIRLWTGTPSSHPLNEFAKKRPTALPNSGGYAWVDLRFEVPRTLVCPSASHQRVTVSDLGRLELGESRGFHKEPRLLLE
jgi:hypothetical protein